jgi:hypothetical protein
LFTKLEFIWFQYFWPNCTSTMGNVVRMALSCRCCMHPIHDSSWILVCVEIHVLRLCYALTLVCDHQLQTHQWSHQLYQASSWSTG